jgi:hypothetical protein
MYSDNSNNGWLLISLILAAEADEPESKELEELIRTNRLLADCLALLEAWWNMKPVNDPQAFDLFFEKLLRDLPAEE